MSKISVVLPLLLPDEFCVSMTRFCLDALRINASGKNEVELVIVETGSEHFVPNPLNDPRLRATHRYLNFNRGPDRNYVKDWNAGADAATGEYLVHIGNDVIVGKDWDEALMEPFRRFKDCGMSCTSSREFGAQMGLPVPVPGLVVEGHFTPFCCFGKRWRFDTAYEGGCSDCDMVMQMYTEGFRAYRSYSSVCWHFGPMTTWRRTNHEGDGGQGQVNRGEETFYRRWRNSPLNIFALMRDSQVRYGVEHNALLRMTPPEERAMQQQQRRSG